MQMWTKWQRGLFGLNTDIRLTNVKKEEEAIPCPCPMVAKRFALGLTPLVTIDKKKLCLQACEVSLVPCFASLVEAGPEIKYLLSMFCLYN